jgi:xanthosine utilization system XapX-like protein
MSSAGRNIRSLALRRRTTALQNFGLAAAIPAGVIWANVSLHIAIPFAIATLGLPLVLLGLTEWQSSIVTSNYFVGVCANFNNLRQ